MNRKILFNPLVWICLTIFILVEIIRQAGCNIPVLHWYLNDLICMPLFLASANLLELRLKLTHDFYPLPKLVATLVMISIIYELLLPLTSPKYTCDFADVAAYAFGTFIYYKYSGLVSKTYYNKKQHL